ncbi:MAG: hypothetical protein AAFO04_16645 [Cyanobacteria bacterium J06592_8]
MFGKSIKSNAQNRNHSLKISSAVVLVAIGLLGVVAETDQTPVTHDFKEEINAMQLKEVTIHRYEVTDPTTGSAISVSQIQHQ